MNSKNYQKLITRIIINPSGTKRKPRITYQNQTSTVEGRSSKGKVTMITPSQSTAILSRHASEISTFRLIDLCVDVDRVSSMVAVCNSNEDGEERMLLVDFSRQRMVCVTMMQMF